MLADERDVLASDCEAVGRPISTPTPEFQYKFVGSAGPDFMVVPYGWNRASFYARGGDDRIQTYGGSLVDGGAGNDRLRSGASPYSDTIRGGPGNDVIFVRDRDLPFARGDKVFCGSGTDTVYVDDNKDKPASDCENVRRAR